MLIKDAFLYSSYQPPKHHTAFHEKQDCLCIVDVVVFYIIFPFVP
jgi:hypothetical protein